MFEFVFQGNSQVLFGRLRAWCVPQDGAGIEALLPVVVGGTGEKRAFSVGR